MEKKTITVTIFNEQYNLTTELPKKETEAIAEMVRARSCLGGA